MPISPRRLVDGVDRLAERDAGAQVEGQGHRGKLALMVDRERPDLVGVDVDQRGQRHGGAGQRATSRKCVRATRELPCSSGRISRIDAISVELGEILGDLALADRRH